MLARTLLVWLLLMAIEIVHGVLRNTFLAPLVGDARARQISVFTGSALILAITMLLIRWIRPDSDRSLVGIGSLWLVLTLAFEFSLGRALGRSWPSLLADYDMTQGGLLSIGMVLLALAPWIAAKVRQSS